MSCDKPFIKVVLDAIPNRGWKMSVPILKQYLFVRCFSDSNLESFHNEIRRQDIDQFDCWDASNWVSVHSGMFILLAVGALQSASRTN